ncbi:DNA-binding MarR family transcriptional regulator [Cellulosimicrobium cellulans]|nr:MarR family transcriptional regulator [Cellulosimicrobium cellulans]MBM7818635.1 DNA-binding MarR family transcriptional regulator [Cellulosimicrobium cellulans]
MTHPQYLVMLALWQGARVSERATVTSLADRLRLDPATLSPLLKRLEGAGYLRRVRSTDDARVVEVLLTARGNEPRGAVEDLPSAIAAATGLGGDELDGALELASRMVAAVEEAGSA